MAYWLIKSEPTVYPWSQLVQDGQTRWDGVRNHQAAGHLKAMQIGDQVFFYHSNEGKEIVGVARVISIAYPDPSDASGMFVCVDVAAEKPLLHPVTLAQMKNHPLLKEMMLIRQSRLSVSPVTEKQWETIWQLSQNSSAALSSPK